MSRGTEWIKLREAPPAMELNGPVHSKVCFSVCSVDSTYTQKTWNMQTLPGTKPGWYIPAKHFLIRLLQPQLPFFILLERGRKRWVKNPGWNQFFPLHQFFLLVPNLCQCGPSQCTIPVHHSFHSPDPIPALSCPRPHTVQAPSQSTSKARLHKGASARFPRVTFLQDKAVMNPASIYPQPSALWKANKYCLKGVSCASLGLTASSAHAVTAQVHLQGQTGKSIPAGCNGKRRQTKFLTSHSTHTTPQLCYFRKEKCNSNF